MPRLGFIMLSHQQPDEIFYRLLERINEFPDYVIGLHHDFTQSKFDFNVLGKFNINLALPCRQTQWGHASKVPATLDAFRAIFEIENNPDWYITISPNCYPIKPSSQILEFLENSQFDAYINLNLIEPNSELENCRNKYRFLTTRGLIKIPFLSRKGEFYFRTIRYPIPKQSLPFDENSMPFFGSDWIMFNRKSAQFLFDANLYQSDLLQHLANINRQKDVLVSPIEIIFHTFFGNSSHLKICKNNYRFIDWEDSINYHPNTLTTDHWQKILGSEALFARKFKSPNSLELLSRIDRDILKI